MCAFNSLKKKLHLKKLTLFLNAYKYCIFYHCKSNNNLKKHNNLNSPLESQTTPNVPTLAHGQKDKNILFLANSSRLASLTGMGGSHMRGATKGKTQTVSNNKSQVNQVDLHKHPLHPYNAPNVKYKVHTMCSLVLQATPMGNTLIVGCLSLEQMQSCIKRYSRLSAQDYLCLGGIYNSRYINSAQCLRLSGMQTQGIYMQLLHTFNNVSNTLCKQLHMPGRILHRVLQTHSKHNSAT